MVVPEVGIGVFLYFLLGEYRRTHVEEVINILDACEKFRHLEVYRFTDLAVIYSTVVNKDTKIAYPAPDNISDLADRGIIRRVSFKNEEELNTELQKKGFVSQNRLPLFIELLPNKD